ncbi:hypothetical protein HNQ60_000078 [Povalibacter uvarum]|uniref:PBP domain-containing protein n=1 Tax=Povalibacter uvarum TaxID=732238 RepID=A0A841HG68_9GAMM|nr:hypothetical protein [Povalibacter uvarum]MBB6091232.1 hypothetical protein [Povalibacter uvarum]
MNMLKVAVAGALCLGSAGAWAVDPAAFDDTAPVVLRVGGATASDNTLRNLFALDPADAETGNRAACQAGSLDIYTRGNDFLISCLSTANVVGLATGSHIVVVKETAGGSANGVLPVARQSNLSNFITPTEANIVANCTAAATNAGGAGGLMSYQVRSCATTLTNTAAPPHVGISDIDPRTFIGTAGVTAADAAALSVDPGLQVLFAPIVSEALRNRLQTVQGLTSGSDTLANVPSIPKSVLAGIFSGQLLDWSQVYINGQQVGISGDTSAYLCRRGETSGTQTSFEIQFLNENCNRGEASATFVAPDQPSCLNGGCAWSPTTGGAAGQFGDDFVFAGAGSGDVRNCVSFNTATQYRIGTASTERLPLTTGTADRFRYVRVDGQEPTLVAAQEGRYNFFTENTLNTRNPDVTTAGGNRAIWTHIRTRIGDRAAVSATNAGFQNAAALGTTGGAADTGILVTPVAGSIEPVFPIVAANVRSPLAANGGPVNSQTRTLPGSAPNNCNAPITVVPPL